MSGECTKPDLTGIAFIRPRIIHPDGWYYKDHPADEIANNAIDDIEVCLEKIDFLESVVAAAIATDCDCLLRNPPEGAAIGIPCSHESRWWHKRDLYRQLKE